MKTKIPFQLFNVTSRGLMLVVVLIDLLPGQAAASGAWTALTNLPENPVAMALVLSDGTVMAANNPADANGEIGNAWYRLTPDSSGSYAKGTWTTRAAMNYTRLFYASTILRDGRLFVAGGEYGNGAATAEIYDPTSDAWTIVSPPASILDPSLISPTTGRAQGIYDAECKVMLNGNVMIAPISPKVNKGTILYSPVTNSWSTGPVTRKWLAESGWVKLPDGSFLTIDPDSLTSERYLPSVNTWISDNSLPVSLWATLPGYVGETGPAFLLPDGRAIFFGGAGHTALYTPSGDNSHGNWVQGPDIPAGLVAADSPGAMLVNGKILLAVAPAPFEDSFGNPIFPSPTSFFEYDYRVGTTGSFTQVSSPIGGLTDTCKSYQCTMLDLPDGTVLYCHVQQSGAGYEAYGKQLYVYTPDGSPLAVGKPSINSITAKADGTFRLMGTLLNGISEGAAYGDDAQMDSNYPLVRCTDDRGNVIYLRTFNWSSSQVMTGNTVQSTDFSTYNLGPGNYSLSVVVNGIASHPWSFSGPVWTDFGYSSNFGFYFGLYDYPYNTLAASVTALFTNGIVNIKAGNSPETFLKITKPMEIRAIGGLVNIGAGH